MQPPMKLGQTPLRSIHRLRPGAPCGAASRGYSCGHCVRRLVRSGPTRGAHAGIAQAVQASRPHPLRHALIVEVAGIPDAEVACVEHAFLLSFEVAAGAHVFPCHGLQ